MTWTTTRIKAACIALACWAATIGIAWAEEPPVVFQSTETPPFWSAAMPENGVGGALLHLLSDAAGVKYSIEYLPVKRFRSSLAPFIVGDPDILTYKEHRAIFPLLIFRSAFFYYKPHHDVIEFRKLEDLRGHTMGVLRGTIEDQDYFTRKGIRVEESDSEQSLLKKLKKGRVDFAILVSTSGLHMIRQLFPEERDHFTTVAIPGSERPIAVMIDLSDPEGKNVAQRYNRVIKQTLRSRKYRDLLESYIGTGNIADDTYDTLIRFADFYESTWTE